MDVTSVLINDANTPWYNNSQIKVIPGWPRDFKIKISDQKMSPLDAVREKKLQAVISFYEIGAGDRERVQFGYRDQRIKPRFFIDVWAYNYLVLSRIADMVDDYYTKAITIGEVSITDFKSNGKIPTEELCRKQFLLKLEYLKGVTL